MAWCVMGVVAEEDAARELRTELHWKFLITQDNSVEFHLSSKLSQLCF